MVAAVLLVCACCNFTQINVEVDVPVYRLGKVTLWLKFLYLSRTQPVFLQNNGKSIAANSRLPWKINLSSNLYVISEILSSEYLFYAYG